MLDLVYYSDAGRLCVMAAAEAVGIISGPVVHGVGRDASGTVLFVDRQCIILYKCSVLRTKLLFCRILKLYIFLDQ